MEHLKSVVDHSSGGEVESLAKSAGFEDFVVEEPEVVAAFDVGGV
jgi:hypothetical protein